MNNDSILSLLEQKKNENIGKSIEDFDFLKILSRKGDEFVAKVKSKLNNEIYAMKRIKENQAIKRGMFNYIEREVFFPMKLEHENIIGYITYFKENHFLYLITEYIENGDLQRMIQSKRNGRFKIKEEKLMRIFLQCLKILSYIHSKGIIFRGFTPERILIDNNNTIKITNFKYAALYDENKSFINLGINQENLFKSLKNRLELIDIGDFKAPEMKKNNYYDEKIDVYSMGIIFCSLAYLRKKIPGENCAYSTELKNFISKMVEEDSSKRLSAYDAYEELKNIYVKKYLHTSGIISSLRCLSSLPNINQDFLGRILKLIPEGKDHILQYLYHFIDIISKSKQLNVSGKNFGEQIKENLDVKIYNFLEIIKKKRLLKTDINKEISPKEFLFIVFNSIENELKLNKLNVYININDIIGQNNNENQVNFNNQQTSLKEKLFLILKYFNFTSLITENFSVYIKKNIHCLGCNENIQFYKKNQFLVLDVKRIKELLKNNLNIKNIFDNINKSYESTETCQKCKNKTNFDKKMSLFNISKDLIILFNRGENCKYKDFINFEKELTLDQRNVEIIRCNSGKYVYELYGVLIRKEKNDDTGYNKRIEEYIYYTRDLNENFFTRNDLKITNNLNELKSEGDVMGLYYYCKNLDKINNAQINQSINQDNNQIEPNTRQVLGFNSGCDNISNKNNIQNISKSNAKNVLNSMVHIKNIGNIINNNNNNINNNLACNNLNNNINANNNSNFNNNMMNNNININNYNDINIMENLAKNQLNNNQNNNFFINTNKISANQTNNNRYNINAQVNNNNNLANNFPNENHNINIFPNNSMNNCQNNGQMLINQNFNASNNNNFQGNPLNVNNSYNNNSQFNKTGYINPIFNLFNNNNQNNQPININNSLQNNSNNQDINRNLFYNQQENNNNGAFNMNNIN